MIGILMISISMIGITMIFIGCIGPFWDWSLLAWSLLGWSLLAWSLLGWSLLVKFLVPFGLVPYGRSLLAGPFWFGPFRPPVQKVTFLKKNNIGKIFLRTFLWFLKTCRSNSKIFGLRFLQFALFSKNFFEKVEFWIRISGFFSENICFLTIQKPFGFGRVS